MPILVADDEPAVRDVLRRALKLEGHDVILASDGEEALTLAAEERPDLIVLDVRMPRADGLTVCRRLRANDDDTPILMLTARDAIDQRVEGLEAGADDYLVKPFDTKELLARVKALLRRRPAEEPDELAYADLAMDRAAHRATRGTRTLDLTRMEWRLLEVLMEDAERVLSRKELFERVWGYDFGSDSNTLDVHIGYVRRKLENDGEERLVHTVRGFGYVLREGAEDD